METNSKKLKVLIVLSSLLFSVYWGFDYNPNNIYAINTYGHINQNCLGIPIAEDIIITAWHCGKKKKIKIDNQFYNLKLIKIKHSSDLEIYKVIDYKFTNYINLAKENSYFGYIFGNGCSNYTDIGRLAFFYTVLDNVSPSFSKFHTIDVDVYYNPLKTCKGDSGGLVVNKDNELLGMVSMIKKSPSSRIFYVIPSRDIKRILNDTFHSREW